MFQLGIFRPKFSPHCRPLSSHQPEAMSSDVEFLFFQTETIICRLLSNACYWTRNKINEQKTHAHAHGQTLVAWASVLVHMQSYLHDLIRGPTLSNYYRYKLGPAPS